MGMKRIKKGLSVFLVFCMTLMQVLWSGIFAMPAYARTGNGTLTEDSNLFNLEAENITFGENAKITFTFPENTKGEVCLSIYDFEESLVAEGYYSLLSDMQGKVVWTPPEDIPVGFYEANANIYRDNDEYDYENLQRRFKVTDTGTTPCTVNVDVYDIIVNKDEIITVYLPEDATGKVFLHVEDSDGNEIGHDSFTIDPEMPGKVEWGWQYLSAGEYTIYAEYLGDEKYAPANGDGSFTVTAGAAACPIQVTAENIVAGDDANITVTLPEDATGNVFLYAEDSDGNEIASGFFIIDPRNPGKVEWGLTDLPAGEYTVYAEYLGDEKYAPSNRDGSFTVTVGETECPIQVTAADIRVTQDEKITVTLPEDATGKVYLHIENSDGDECGADSVSIAPEMHGTGEAVFDYLPSGEYTVYAEYSGNGTYAPANGVDDFTVTGGTDPCEIEVEVSDIAVGEYESITVTLPEDATGKVFMYITYEDQDTETHRINFTSDNHGTKVLPLSGLAAGYYYVYAEYLGNEKYGTAHGDGSFNVIDSGSDQYSVDIELGFHMTPEDSFGYLNQTVTAGVEITPVVITADSGYHFSDDCISITGAGITAELDSDKKQITITGAPTENVSISISTAISDIPKQPSTTKVEIENNAADQPETLKVTVPSDATGRVKVTVIDPDGGYETWFFEEWQRNQGVGQRSLTHFDAAGDYTVTAEYEGDNKYESSIGTAAFTLQAAGLDRFSVIINLGNGMTLTSGDETVIGGGYVQFVTAGNEIETIVITANTGYYFPEDYTEKITAVNGIGVTRENAGQIKVSGIPTSEVNLSLPDASAKITPGAPSVEKTDCTTRDNNNGKITGVNSTMEYQKDGDTDWTPISDSVTEISGLTPGVYHVRYKETDTTNASEQAVVEIQGFAGPAITIKARNQTYTYNGQPQGESSQIYNDPAVINEKVTVEGLLDGDQLAEIGLSGQGTEVGQADIDITSFTIKDTNGADVTNIYSDVITETGILTIEQAALTITANYQEYVYNGEFQGEDGTTYDDPAQIAEKVTVSELQGQDYLHSIVLNGQGQDAGTYEIVPSGAVICRNGEDVTGNYEITYANGTLKINGSSSAPEMTVSADDINYGETAVITVAFSASVTGSVTLTLTHDVSGEIKMISENLTGTTEWECTVSELAAGKWNVEASYFDENNVLTATGLATFSVGASGPEPPAPDTAQVDVNTVWNDVNNNDGIRPDSVTIILLANGTETGDTMVLSEENGWAGSFRDLPILSSGQVIVYTVAEEMTDVITGDDGPGTYKSDVSGNATQGFWVTNTHTPEVMDITVTKVWDDAGYEDKRPGNIMIHLFADGSEVFSNDIAIDTENDSFSFSETVPKYSNGQEIEYTVTEDPVNNYTTVITGSVKEGFTITNKYASPSQGGTAYDVVIEPGSHMTKTTDSGEVTQHVVTGTASASQFTEVVFTADNGYYFPDTYHVEPVSGISVERDSDTQIRVTGQPNGPGGEITITLADAEKKETPASSWTVSFDPGDGSGTMDIVPDVSGNYKLPECLFNAPKGKTFDCWLVNGSEYAPGQTIKVTGDTVVTAQWKDVPAHVHKLSEVKAKEPTCTENGNETYYQCSGCDLWFWDGTGTHKIDDKKEAVIPAKGHKWDGGTVTKEATETEDGIRTYTCQNGCGATRTEIIPATGSGSDDSGESGGSSSGGSSSGGSSSGGSSSGGSSSGGSSSGGSSSGGSGGGGGSSSGGGSSGGPKGTSGSSGGPGAGSVLGASRSGDSSGSWTQDDAGWYYLENGEPVVNDWRYISYNGKDCWYLFNNDGVMQTGWLDWNGNRYYLNPVSDGWKGSMLTGWQMIGGKWYYFEPAPGSNQGRMYRSEWNNEGYYLGADGVWVENPVKTGN